MKTNVRGIVIDTDGNPLEGETLLVFSGGGKEQTAIPDKKTGAYEILGLDTAIDYKVSVINDKQTLYSDMLSLKEKEEQEHNITVDTDGGTTMTTTSTTTTGTTTTGSTTTGTTTTGTTTTGTSTTGTTTTGTSTTGTTTSGTTMTVPGSGFTVSPPGNGTLGRLLDAVRDIDLHPPVNVEEAEEFRRLFIVANYTAAGVHDAVAALNGALTSESDVGPTMINKSGLLNDVGQTIDDVLEGAAEDHNNRQMLMREARAQFDLGSEPAETVNTEFKDLFREFIGYCSDELMAFNTDDPKIKDNPLMTPERIEEGVNFLRRTKRALISVMESMSRSGRLGTDRLIRKWADLAADSIDVLKKVGDEHVATDDQDQKHIWSVVAALNDRPKTDIEPYLVHAKEGADNLDTVIKAYNKIRAMDKLADEDGDYLRNLFHDQTYLSFPDPDRPGATLSLSQRLRKGATLVQEKWIPEWV